MFRNDFADWNTLTGVRELSGRYYGPAPLPWQRPSSQGALSLAAGFVF